MSCSYSAFIGDNGNLLEIYRGQPGESVEEVLQGSTKQYGFLHEGIHIMKVEENPIFIGARENPYTKIREVVKEISERS